MMNYTEIAKFLNFVLQLSFKIATKDHPSSPWPDQQMDSLKNYDLNQVLVEIHKNYKQSWADERISNQMNKDYERYLSILEHYLKKFPKKEQRAVRVRYNQIKGYLDNPTFLDPTILHSMSSQGEEVNFMEDREKEPVPLMEPNAVRSSADVEFTTSQRILKELNIIAWIFESQKMKASQTMNSFPLLHKDGRYSGVIKIASSEPLFNFQHHIQKYTERYEKLRNNNLLKKELTEIKVKMRKILSYYHEELSPESTCFKNFKINIPEVLNEQKKYWTHHTLLIVVDSMEPDYINFGEEFQEASEFNYFTSNIELSQYCEKLLDFIRKITTPFGERGHVGTDNNVFSRVRIEMERNRRLEQKEKEKETSTDSGNSDNNPYPQVFVDIKAYKIFDRLYQNKKDSSTPLAEFSFIYRRMWKDNLLQEFQRPEVFRKWLAEEKNYALVLPSAIKRLAEIGYQQIKEEAYQSAKELIKQ
ncbi:hypothetical protein RM545_06405 [Zunongwangia sp. F260]|uniref:Uncharacterized protein n=1 Tax=Autumnicola lenta TaxID=3075593 RepID=A0ABU3CJ25_9FLAO|nr:hypothetical protein [Zunongwangia sp. F260]MDT0646316.1 hypothetical protein [Zunongwangia sp. F260]